MSTRGIQHEIENDYKFAQQCADKIRKSRIIVRPDDTSFINKVGVYVMTIIYELGKGYSYLELIEKYPNLTKEDIEDCLLFILARSKKKI